MLIRDLHRFAVSLKEARQIQEKLREMLVLEAPGMEFRLVAGADVSFPRSRSGPKSVPVGARAGIVLIDIQNGETVEEVVAEAECLFPYIPGFLTFREGPAVLEAFRRLKKAPDLVIFDGQGIAHPRGLGLASHLGLFLNLPSIGCAKSRLVGEYREPGKRRGSSSALVHEGREVGRVLRTRSGVKPVFISPGHRMDSQTAAKIVLKLASSYRLPEPTRRAHNLVSKHGVSP